MAILSGFPPSNTISPSVRIAERDLSFITATQSFHRAGLVGFASKGPVNLPTLVTSTRQLHTYFGYAHPDVSDPFLIYAAEQYLLVATELFVVRVADVDPVSDESATLAQVEIPAAGSTVQIESALAGPYVFYNNSFFRWKLNGILSSKTLVVMGDVMIGKSYTTQELVDELNSQLDINNDGIEFYVTGIDSIAVRTVWAYGPSASIELVSILDSIYGGTTPLPPVGDGNITGLGTGMTAASVTGAESKYPNVGYQVSGYYNFTGLTGLNLVIVVDGTDHVLIDQVAQVIDLSVLSGDMAIADIVTAINNEKTENGGTLPGGWEAVVVGGTNLGFKTMTYGVESRLRIKPESTAAALFGLDNYTHTGVSPSRVTGDLDTGFAGIVHGAVNTNDAIKTFLVTADSVGIEGNLTQVHFVSDVRQSTFSVEVLNNGVVVESWGNLTKNQASSYYVETYLQLVSNYIRVVDYTSEGAGPKNGYFSLVGGSDGIPADPDKQDALLIGNDVGYTGIYTLSEPEQVDIDLIAVPGHSSTAVVHSLLNFCQSYRQDCLAIIDPPFGLTVEEIIAWQNGTHPLNDEKFDSDFGALYWPWVKINDTHNRVEVWIPPSGSVMAVIARSDFLSAPWFAPAGITRGSVPNITDVYSRPTLTERDLMYGYRNCINPIVQFTDVQGFLVWGQKTLQRTPTALDRVNVRRCLFYIEKQIRANTKVLIFDPNDSALQGRFTAIAKAILDVVRAGRGVYDYRIVCDSTINTPDVIDRNEFRAQIGIQPTRAAEFMFVEFTINRTGDFTTPAYSY